MDIPHCFNTALFTEGSSLCVTCPAYLACAAHRGAELTQDMKKRDFLRELLIQGVPPLVIDKAYCALYGVALNAARAARKYHRRKLDNLRVGH